MSTNDPMTEDDLDAIRWRLDCGAPTTADVSALLSEVEWLRHFESTMSWWYGYLSDGRTREDMIKRATRAFGAATAQVSSIPFGMSEDTFINSVGLQHQHAIRAVIDVALNPEEA